MAKEAAKCAAEVEFRALADKIGAKVVAKIQPGWSKTAESDPAKYADDAENEFAKSYVSSVYKARRHAQGEVVLYLDPSRRWGPSHTFTDCASWSEALVDLRRYLRQNHADKFSLDELTTS